MTRTADTDSYLAAAGYTVVAESEPAALSRDAIDLTWAANELIGVDLETALIVDIVEDLCDRICVATQIADDDADGWAWVYRRAETLVIALVGWEPA